MTEQRDIAAAANAPIPYMQRTRSYYEALGYGAPYEWAHYAEVPFHPLGKPLSGCRIALITTASPYQPGKGDQGPGAPYNAAAKFYAVYSGDARGRSRPAHLACRHRSRQHDRRGSRDLFSAAPAAREPRLRPDRIARLPLSRPADQSKPPGDARNRLPGDRRPLQGRRRGCGDPRAELSGLPPERQPRGAHAGGKRHRHGHHGLREGHRRACRRAAFPVLRFPARQFRGPSERPAVAGERPSISP